ncbi:MAG: nitric-oxide reductase large subunit [Elusimicrobiales bacterium]
MKTLRRLAIASFVVSMLTLLGGGYFAMKKVAPYPERIVAGDKVLATGADLMAGQGVYQKYGLMDHGSVWGHGTLRGPEFSAETLHLMGVHMREHYARAAGGDYASLPADKRAGIDAAVIKEIKANTYDAATRTLTVSPARAYALERVTEHWAVMLRLGDKGYGFLPGTIKTDEEAAAIGKFFFWTAWVAGTNRPGENATFTNNWPPDASVGNFLSEDAFIWSVISIIALLLVLGLVIYILHRYRLYYGEAKGVQAGEALHELPLTPSQVKSAKYFVVVSLLFLVQTLMGGLLAQSTTRPASFYPDIVAKLIPYSFAKSWHLQLAILWIAASWIGASIYLAPIISGKEPKHQGLLVDLLFGAVILVAVGSLVGTALGVHGVFSEKLWFWFGHQGWEYLELGRFWQILLFVGLVAWLLIVYRGLKDRLYGPQEDKSGVVAFYVLSAIMVVGFFAFGLFYGKTTHLTVADYWRWFVVHIWVEGIFEFFGVAVISMFLVMLGLVQKEAAMKVAYFTAILVFASGIIGTAHHYYWFGGPTYWVALGSVFSSLEPIPLILLVVRAWMEYKSIDEAGEKFAYYWPLLFITASSFWNFVGAGVFGFSINLPVVNYYEHGTYLTANHGHAALFGVYGLLSIAIMLFAWRSLVSEEAWDKRLLKWTFWSLNLGLLGMVVMTLLPVGLAQTLVAYKHGAWAARSAEFYASGPVHFLLELRAIPDTVVIIGAAMLSWFLLKTYLKVRAVKCAEGQEVYKAGSCRPV